MEYTFDIQVKGEESNLNWTGKFKYKRPTLGDRASIERHVAILNGDLRTIDPIQQDLNYALALLRYTLKEYPEWWKESEYGASLYDANVVLEIHRNCIKYEKEWREKVLSGDPKDVEVTDASSPVAGTA